MARSSAAGVKGSGAATTIAGAAAGKAKNEKKESATDSSNCLGVIDNVVARLFAFSARGGRLGR